VATKLKQESIRIRQNKTRDMSPNWDDAANWEGERFTRHFHSAMAWYRLESSGKDLKVKVIDWMGRNSYDKKIIKAFKDTKDNRCSLTMGSIAACLIKGMPAAHPGFNNGKDSALWLGNEIARVIEEGKYDEVENSEVKVVKSAVVVPSIQDRMREAAGQMSEELDAAIDSWIQDPEAFDPKAFKIASLLRGKGAKAAHSRFIKSYFQKGHAELHELASGEADEQLREAYKHNSRKNVKKLIEFYDNIVAACDQIAAEAKVLKKPRAKKIKPAEELIKKLKFKAIDDKLGAVSVPAAQLIGAQSAVIYNTKTRKLGVYIAKSSAGLTVKGTSIDNFTEKSFQKTLRKPVDQLKEFKEQNTAKRVETWFGKIKSVETVLNGRMNADIMILKVFK
jgi:DNA-directed RNA polymerase beta' subunit